MTDPETRRKAIEQLESEPHGSTKRGAGVGVLRFE
jgi:hypothetical protein